MENNRNKNKINKDSILFYFSLAQNLKLTLTIFNSGWFFYRQFLAKQLKHFLNKEGFYGIQRFCHITTATSIL
jgi:hypothetical protein